MNGVQYAKPYGREVVDVFTCIRGNTLISTPRANCLPKMPSDISSPIAKCASFRDLPEAIENTQRLAKRLTFSLENIGYEFPDYPVPAGHSMDSFLRTIVWFGAQQRYAGISAAVKRQLEEELTSY